MDISVIDGIDKLKRILILYPFILTFCIIMIFVAIKDTANIGNSINNLSLIISMGIGYYFGSKTNMKGK